MKKAFSIIGALCAVIICAAMSVVMLPIIAEGIDRGAWWYIPAIGVCVAAFIGCVTMIDVLEAVIMRRDAPKAPYTTRSTYSSESSISKIA